MRGKGLRSAWGEGGGGMVRVGKGVGFCWGSVLDQPVHMVLGPSLVG